MSPFCVGGGSILHIPGPRHCVFFISILVLDKLCCLEQAEVPMWHEVSHCRRADVDDVCCHLYQLTEEDRPGAGAIYPRCQCVEQVWQGPDTGRRARLTGSGHRPAGNEQMRVACHAGTQALYDVVPMHTIQMLHSMIRQCHNTTPEQ